MARVTQHFPRPVGSRGSERTQQNRFNPQWLFVVSAEDRQPFLVGLVRKAAKKKKERQEEEEKKEKYEVYTMLKLYD